MRRFKNQENSLGTQSIDTSKLIRDKNFISTEWTDGDTIPSTELIVRINIFSHQVLQTQITICSSYPSLYRYRLCCWILQKSRASLIINTITNTFSFLCIGKTFYLYINVWYHIEFPTKYSAHLHMHVPWMHYFIPDVHVMIFFQHFWEAKFSRHSSSTCKTYTQIDIWQVKVILH